MQIAKLNAMLVATASGFSATFSKAGKSVQTFGDQVTGVAGKMTAIAGAIGLTAAAYGLQALVRAQMETIDSTAKMGDTLGIATEKLMGLQYAASYSGASIDDLQSGLVRMTRLIGEAALGAPAAASAIAALGLNATDLANMSPDEAFKKIADALNGITNPAQRAAAANDIFGKGFAKLMPLIREGSGGLDRFAEEAVKTGYALSRVDAAKVEMANDAIQRVSNAVTGVANQIAVSLSPYLQALANQLVDSATAGEGMGSKVSGAIEWVASAVAYTSDYLKVFEMGWHTLKAVVIGTAAVVVKMIAGVGQGLAALVNLLPGVEVEWGNTMSLMADELAVLAKEAGTAALDAADEFSSGANAAAVAKFFDDARNKAQSLAEEMAKKPPSGLIDGVSEQASKVGEQIDKLKDELATLGMSKGDKLGFELGKAGATPDQIAQATSIQNQIDAAEATKKAHEDATDAAKKYYEETRTPAEKYAAEIERINELLMKGALDSETAQRAADLAGKSFADASKDKTKESGGPELLQAGSAAAAKFLASASRRENGNDPQAKVAKNTATANTILGRIETKIGATTAEPVIVNF